MMRWMVDVVGETGKIVAVDIDTRFVANAALPNLEVCEADIRDISWSNNSFDLIHARYVLIHIADFQSALSKMLNSLKPGGWLVIEEPDFSAARALIGEKEECESVNKVNRAILRMFTDRGMDCSLGVKLPSIFQNFGLQLHSVENDAPLSAGGSGVATMMKMSTVQLAQKYIATGEATDEDVQKYCRFAENPSSWAVYYATVGVIGQKVEENS